MKRIPFGSLAVSLLLAGAVAGTGWCASPPFPGIHPPILTHPKIPRANSASQVAGDESWWDGFGAPVPDGGVSCAIEYQGSVVIAGQFSRIGDVFLNDIARWDGTQWAPLGQGLEWGRVNCLTIQDGYLIAAGVFTFAGGVVARSVARWDGITWSAFGRGIEDSNTNPINVTSVISYGGTLVASADLQLAGYRWGSRLVSWTGTDWTDFGAVANGPVWALAVMDGDLFAGGAFDSIAGVPAAGLARWDGSSWSPVGEGLGSSGGTPMVSAFTLFDGRLVAGGSFTSAGGQPAQDVAAWDGASWEGLGTGPANGVSALAVRQDTLFAAAWNGIRRWNGTEWDDPGPPLVGTPAALAPDGNDFVVVGPIEASNPGSVVPVALSIARLSGGSWSAMTGFTGRMRGLVAAGGGQGWVSSMVPHRDHLLAAGKFAYAGDPPGWAPMGNLADWDGTRWSQFPAPPDAYEILGLLAKGDTLYASAISNHGFAPGETPVFFYRSDGTHWTALDGSPVEPDAMTLYRGDLCVAGVTLADMGESRVLRWNGAGWDLIGTATGGSSVPVIEALVEYQGSLIAAGRFLTMDGVPAANIASWDGSAWHPLGAGFPPPPYLTEAIVRALCVVDGGLLATGDAVAAGPVASTVARWTGGTWEPLGGRVGAAYYLASVGGELLIGGDLHEEGSGASETLLRWTGSDWRSLGSGTNGVVTSFAAFGGSIYVGGVFSEAGGKPSFAIARWDGVPHAVPEASLRSPQPNPFRSATSFSYSTPVAGIVRIRVYDVHGREVVMVEQRAVGSGTYTATWDGRDRDGRALPSGVYFVQAQFPGGITQSRKAVLLK